MVQTSSRLPKLSLELPENLSLTVSQAQFDELVIANRDLQLERTAEGVLIVNPPTGWETGERNFSLAVELGIWLRSSGIEGKAFDSSTGFILPNGATRSPDISWISQARWASLSDEQKSTFASVCPEFVIELRSSSDRLKPIQEKMQEYIDNGAKLGWLINPQNRQVEIYRNRLPVEILDAPSELSGEQVLPGFVLNPNLIWS